MNGLAQSIDWPPMGAPESSQSGREHLMADQYGRVAPGEVRRVVRPTIGSGALQAGHGK
jgi:hypothetical protein